MIQVKHTNYVKCSLKFGNRVMPNHELLELGQRREDVNASDTVESNVNFFQVPQRFELARKCTGKHVVRSPEPL